MNHDKRNEHKTGKLLRAAGTAGIVLGGMIMDTNVAFALEEENDLTSEVSSENQASEREPISQMDYVTPSECLPRRMASAKEW